MVDDETRDARRNDFNNGNSAEDAQEGPKRGHQVAHGGRLVLAVAKPPGDGIREVTPWRRRQHWVDELVNVEIPLAVAHLEKQGALNGFL